MPDIVSTVQSQEVDPSMPAKTTFQEDLVTAGQRRVNLVWEYTQASIAIVVVLANMIVAVYTGLLMEDKKVEFPSVLSNTLFLIVGFYFSRTNHAAIGGVGPKPNSIYTGR